MSVINKMLRDLEARRAAPAAAPEGVQATTVHRHNGRALALLLLGGAAAGAMAFGDWPALLTTKPAAAPAPLQVTQNDDPPAAGMLAASAAGGLPTLETASAAVAAVAAVAPVAPAAVPTPMPAPAAPPLPSAAAPGAAAKPADAAPRARLVPEQPARTATPTATSTASSTAPTPTTATATAGAAGGHTAPAGRARADKPTLSALLHTGGAAPGATPHTTLIAAAAMAAPPAGPASIDKRMALVPTAQRAQALYQQGLDLAATGHGRQAVEQLQAALKLDPRLAAARIHTVSLLLEQGRGTEAEALAREGLALSDEPQLAAVLARVLADRGDTADALAVLDRSERLSAEGFGLRAGLRAQQGQFSRALPDYEQAVRLQPGNSLWWLGLGVALEAEGRSQQARQVYGRAQAIGMDRSELSNFVEQKLQQLE
ncbi:MAG: hypothetical protein AD742_06360 [Methylibium sp. NZG]|nr:MAG: hypothetical protein AD742_06360 [Methylibium sp. NZG]